MVHGRFPVVNSTLGASRDGNECSITSDIIGKACAGNLRESQQRPRGASAGADARNSLTVFRKLPDNSPRPESAILRFIRPCQIRPVRRQIRNLSRTSAIGPVPSRHRSLLSQRRLNQNLGVPLRVTQRFERLGHGRNPDLSRDQRSDVDIPTRDVVEGLPELHRVVAQNELDG